MAAKAQLSFRTDIRPMFTDTDVAHMVRASQLDLSDYQTVKTHAAAIYDAVATGAMPPANSGEPRWTEAMCATFQEWQTQGCPP